jgi:predicted  nucleic acid-binding Zn-ribbon protein
VSHDERPEFLALEELQEVLRGVADELAAWRRRAQRAEAMLGEGHDALVNRERLVELEAENRATQERLAVARARVEELMKRLQFLEDQMALEEQTR